MTRLLFICGALLAATSASAQVDPSNPAGAPPAPNQGPTSRPTQGQVIRDAAPSATNDDASAPRAPSVLNGVEESQRIGTTQNSQGEPPATDRNPAPIETGPSPR